MEEGKVGLYVCGVTVYDLCHIGHAPLDHRVRYPVPVFTRQGF